jgi:hypothetical protein
MKSKLDRNRRQAAVTHKPALAYPVEWKANQKGRRPLVFRLSNALVRVCAEKGVSSALRKRDSSSLSTGRARGYSFPTPADAGLSLDQPTHCLYSPVSTVCR